MAKEKISATITPERLARARAVMPASNVSEILDEALDALVERELERRWLAAHQGDDLPGPVAPDLSSVPWDDEA